MFRDAFYDKYFPKSVRKQKEREFTYLQQRSKIVAEYEVEFNHLAKFAPLLISTEESRTWRFEERLRFSIEEAVISLELTKYSEVMSKALLVKKA